MTSIIYSVLIGSLLGFPAINQLNNQFGAISPNALNKAYYGDSKTSPTPCTTTSAAPTSAAPTPTPTAPVHLEYNGLVLPSLDDPLPAPVGDDSEEEKKKKEETAKQSSQADQGKTESSTSSDSPLIDFQSSSDNSAVSTKGFPGAFPQADPGQIQQFLKGQPQQPNQQWNQFKPSAFVAYNLDNKPVTPFALGGPQTYTIVPTKEEQEALAAKNKAAAEASKQVAQQNGLQPQQGQQSQPGQPLPQLQPQQGQQPRPQQFSRGQQQPNAISNFPNISPTYFGKILGGNY